MSLQAFMDESGTDDSSTVLCVAGYVFTKPQAKKFSRQWRAALAKANTGKPTQAEFFRMSDCAHGAGQFEGWDRQDCIAIETALIKHVHKRTEFGYAVTLNEDDYNERLAGRSGMPSAYAFACFAALGMIRRWALKRNYAGEIAYFFESGHEHQRNANGFLDELFTSTRTRDQYWYAGHAFRPKEKDACLQSGDLLAWHAVKHHEREARGEGMRKDLQALVRADHDMRRHYDIPAMERLAKALLEKGIPDDDPPFKPRRASRKASTAGQPS